MSTDDASHDRQFFDLFILVIGLLVGIAFGIFLLARYVAGNTQERFVREDTAYQAEVAERIEPLGRVAITGAAVPADEAAAPEVITPEPVAARLSGPQVYNQACLACHGAGIGGAPKVGDTAAWAPRIAQGPETLREHVLNGYQGEAGYMPPKGGRVDLSDEEIIAALDYMVEESS